MGLLDKLGDRLSDALGDMVDGDKGDGGNKLGVVRDFLNRVRGSGDNDNDNKPGILRDLLGRLGGSDSGSDSKKPGLLRDLLGIGPDNSVGVIRDAIERRFGKRDGDTFGLGIISKLVDVVGEKGLITSMLVDVVEKTFANDLLTDVVNYIYTGLEEGKYGEHRLIGLCVKVIKNGFIEH